MLVDKYETELTRVLDIHAQEKKRTITVRPAAAWYNGDIDREKRKRQKFLAQITPVIDREFYKEQCKVVSFLILKAKENYYSNIVQENKGNQRCCLTQLPGSSTVTLRSAAPSSEALANRFVDFFCKEMEVIRNDLFA